MDNSATLLLSRLDEYYLLASGSKDEKQFLINLFNYLQFLNTISGFEPIFKKLDSEKTSDLAVFNALEVTVLQEMDDTIVQVEKYVAEQGITNAFFLELIANYRAYARGGIESTAGPIGGRYGEVSRLFVTLSEMEEGKYHDLAAKFGKVDDKGFIYQWTFSPHYDQYDQEKKYIMRVQQVKPWHDWEKLVNFHQIFLNYEKIREDLYKNHQLFSMMGLSMIYEEIQAILDGKTVQRGRRFFDESDYRSALDRIHLYIKNHLSELQLSQPSQLSVPVTKGSKERQDRKSEPKDAVLSIGQRFDSTVVIYYMGNEYRLCRPRMNSNSDKLMQTLTSMNNAQRVVRFKNDQPDEDHINESLSRVITHLQLTGILRKIFFPHVSKSELDFVRWYDKQHLVEASVTEAELKNEIEKLPLFTVEEQIMSIDTGSGQ